MKIFEAIQSIPGESAHEKRKWIAVEIKALILSGKSLEEIVEIERFPQPLRPLIKVEAAKILIRMGHESQDHYEAIAEGLRSENSEVVDRALGSSNFFDNSNQTITNVEYFFNNLFPHVSYNTRGKIIKKLARCLGTQNSPIAEKFFEAILSVYGVEQAMPLLMPCSESFIKEMVTKYRIKLSTRILEIFSWRHPPLVVWYLKLSDPALKDPLKRFNHHIQLHQYTSSLARLILSNLSAFIEIYELHGENALWLQLSNTQSKSFAKNAREHYLSKPKIFFKLLKLEDHDEHDIETMFPKLFPDKAEDLNVDEMLKHLEHYPKKKSASLLLSSYENIYGKSLLEDEKNVTEELMKLLPKEERIKQARLKIKKQEEKNTIEYGTHPWSCYLSTEEVLPKLREQVTKTAEVNERGRLISQMLFCCEVNEDYASLLEVFKNVRERHRNEVPVFHHTFLRYVQETHDTLKLSRDHWDVLFEIVQRMYVKAEVSDFRSISMEFLEKALHYRLTHDLPTETTLEMMFFAASRSSYYWIAWNYLTDYPEYERLCLTHFLRLAEKQCNATNSSTWNEIKIGTTSNLIKAIYEYNKRPVKGAESKKIPLRTEDFPWLFTEFEKIVKENPNHYYLYAVKEALRKHAIDLYYRFWVSERGFITIDTINLLKKDPRSVLSDLEKYFDECQTHASYPVVHRFVRSLRWYNEIPVKFVERCINGVTKDNHGVLLILLALLVDVETFDDFIEPLLPTEKKIDVAEEDAKEKFNLIHHIPAGMKRTISPVPLELIQRLCEGDYLSSALTTLTHSCTRTSITKVIPFAKNLSNQRVSVAKHGVRLMSLVASIEQLCEFLSSCWKEQEHHSVRKIVLSEAQRLFTRTPSPVTWQLMKTIISSISEKEESLLTPWPFNVSEVPDEYIGEYMEIVLEIIDQQEKVNLEPKTSFYAYSFLTSIDVAICNILSEEFVANLLRKYLFDENPTQVNRAEAARQLLTVAYLQTTDEKKLEKRLNTFSEIFVESVKSRWNVSDSPVNSAVRPLITRVVFSKMKLETRSMVIKRVFEIFISILKPEDDAKSYLLLSYANEWVQSKTPSEFANRISVKLPELIHFYTPWFSFHIADALREFLTEGDFDDRKNEDVIREVAETLVEFDTVEVSYTTVQVLLLLNKQNDENYVPMLKKLKKIDHPAVRSLVNSILQ